MIRDKFANKIVNRLYIYFAANLGKEIVIHDTEGSKGNVGYTILIHKYSINSERDDTAHKMCRVLMMIYWTKDKGILIGVLRKGSSTIMNIKFKSYQDLRKYASVLVDKIKIEKIENAKRC